MSPDEVDLVVRDSDCVAEKAKLHARLAGGMDSAIAEEWLLKRCREEAERELLQRHERTFEKNRLARIDDYLDEHHVKQFSDASPRGELALLLVPDEVGLVDESGTWQPGQRNTSFEKLRLPGGLMLVAFVLSGFAVREYWHDQLAEDEWVARVRDANHWIRG